MPEGLCPWAWIDLYATISSLYAGAWKTPVSRRWHADFVLHGRGAPVVYKLELIRTE
jgi:hypothetical protein